MENATETQGRNITLNDVQLAAAYYAALVDFAKQGREGTISYGDLVDKAKVMFPQANAVQQAIAVSAGRKLDVVRTFTNDRGLPDLTALVVNKSRGECGSGFTDRYDPEEARAKVYAFDWSAVSAEFDVYIKSAEKTAIPKKTRKKPAALALLSEYYQKNKTALPPTIREKRDDILGLLMEGFSAEEAFDAVLK